MLCSLYKKRSVYCLGYAKHVYNYHILQNQEMGFSENVIVIMTVQCLCYFNYGVYFIHVVLSVINTEKSDSLPNTASKKNFDKN